MEASERSSWGAVILAWLFLGALTGIPFLEAALHPPPNTAFVGTFYYVDDLYNYLSYASQAEDGAFLFRNKVVLDEHRPALVNLEWWLVGQLARLAGHRPLLAYRAFGLFASFFLLLAADHWLRAGGSSPRHRLAGLLLIATGAGSGGLLLHVFDRPARQCADLITGLYPFIEVLGNPHFVAGTALLAWSLWFLGVARGGTRWGIALGSILGIVRPYDLVLLVAIRLLVVIRAPPRQWIPGLLPLGAFLPVALYNAYIFYWDPAFAFYARAVYVYPGVGAFLWALGPPLLLAATTLACKAPSAAASGARAHLLAWTLLGLALVTVQPGRFWAQFVVGLGLPVLTLGAIGLGCFRPAFTLLAAALLSGTAATAIAITRSPQTRWFVPASHMAVARSFRGVCQEGDLALAPPQIGLYLAGLSPCRAYSSHAIEPDHERRATDAGRFYEDVSPAWRAALLDSHCVTHVVLPASGPVPSAWLGEGTPFRESSPGAAPGPAIYSRPGRQGCS